MKFHISVANVYEEDRDHVGPHFNFAIIAVQIRFLHSHVLVQNWLHFEVLEKILIFLLFFELQPPESSQDLLIVVYSLEVFTLFEQFICLFFLLVQVEKQATERLRSQLFQPVGIEQRMQQWGWHLVEGLTLSLPA